MSARTRHRGSRTCWPAIALTCVVAHGAAVRAHDGPPFPIVSNQVAGAYQLSLWTDPDATDDGTPAGQFWVVIATTNRSAGLPPDTRARVAISPLDGRGQPQSGIAVPVNGDPGRQFLALVMDHEGPFEVRATVEGPLGPASIAAQVDATYDQRPPPALIGVYLLPFLLFGGLWLAALRRRWRVKR